MTYLESQNGRGGNVKKDIRSEFLTRQKLENPFSHMNYHERLVKSKAIDLTDNMIIEDLGNAYSKITAIDKTKLVK